MHTEKYGMPETVERFSGREPGTDFLRFYGLLNDECIYKSEFKTKNGSIVLTMKKVDYRTASVIIKYIDNINEEESRKTMMDDL